MSRRSRAREEPESHDRWLVSYADFITLLFAFFVVMYALSTLNEGKYKVFADSLIVAFRNDPQVAAQLIVSMQRMQAPPQAPAPDAADSVRDAKTRDMQDLAERITDEIGRESYRERM